MIQQQNEQQRASRNMMQQQQQQQKQQQHLQHQQQGNINMPTYNEIGFYVRTHVPLNEFHAVYTLNLHILRQ